MSDPRHAVQYTTIYIYILALQKEKILS